MILNDETDKREKFDEAILPLVSVVIPCFNEKKFIGKCLDSMVKQEYPNEKKEILVVDGMSDDGTREIIKEYVNKYTFIKLVDNPKKITPCAFNAGVKASKGDFIMIISAHSAFSANKIARGVEYMNEYDIDGVGGRTETINRDNTLLGKVIAKTISSRFGVGTRHRSVIKKPMLADTASAIMYRRSVFDKIGFFNEKLQKSQDMEFNKRLIKSGGKILIAPDIISYYFSRADFSSYSKHTYANGLWAILPLAYSSCITPSLRHLTPLFFVSSLIVSAVLGIFIPPFLNLLFGVLFLYFVVNIYFSIKIAIESKKLLYFVLLPFSFYYLHFLYGLGSLVGAIKVVMLITNKYMCKH